MTGTVWEGRKDGEEAIMIFSNQHAVLHHLLDKSVVKGPTQIYRNRTLGTSTRFRLFCSMSFNWSKVLLETWFFNTLPTCILIAVMVLPPKLIPA